MPLSVYPLRYRLNGSIRSPACLPLIDNPSVFRRAHDRQPLEIDFTFTASALWPGFQLPTKLTARRLWQICKAHSSLPCHHIMMASQCFPWMLPFLPRFSLTLTARTKEDVSYYSQGKNRKCVLEKADGKQLFAVSICNLQMSLMCTASAFDAIAVLVSNCLHWKVCVSKFSGICTNGHALIESQLHTWHCQVVKETDSMHD